MIDFSFYLPTKIYFGEDKHLQIVDVLREFSYKNILIVCGNHTKKSGLLDTISQLLDKNNIVHHEYVGVSANPDVNYVIDALKIAKDNQVDCILAIGGGSVIDVCKSVAANYYYDKDPYDFNLYKAEPTKALPIGVILTIAAAGSEMSNSCVISNEKLHKKNGFNSNLVRPKFAILNPKLTYTVDKYQTGCGVVDIISHSFERFFNPSKGIEFSDSFALALIKDTMKFGEIAINDPTNFDARGALMLDSSYSHNGFTSLGKNGAFTIHKIEHVLSSFDNKIAHGAGLSVLMPAWMKYVYKYDEPKFILFAKEVFNINYENNSSSAIIGIQSFEQYLKRIGMPTKLTELGILKEDIPLLADMATDGGTRMVGPHSIKPLNKEDIISILNIALEEE